MIVATYRSPNSSAVQLLLAGCFVFLMAAAVLGQTPTPSVTPVVPSAEPLPDQPTFSKPLRPMPGSERVGVSVSSPLSLSIEQAIEMALANNNDIDASRNDTKIAEFSLKGARGVYDPLFNSQSYYESRTTPTASTIGGAVNGSVTQKQLFNDFGVTGFVPKFGGSYDLVFSSSRTNTTNRNATLNPQFPASLIATYTQPLWRNRSIDNNRRSIEIAKKNASISDSQLKQTAIEVVYGVEQAYWNLVLAMRVLEVETEALRQAREQLESNKRLVAKGVLAPIEIVAAQSQISNFEQAVYVAQDGITRAENTLKSLILADRSSADWSRPITPVSPANLTAPTIGVEVATAEALKNRPEIEQWETSADINRIDQQYYRNQTKPQIDLVGTYTSAGLAGTPNPLSSGAATVPDNLKGGYFTSLGNLAAQDYPTYRAGVQIAIPWRNTAAKANLGRSLVEADRIANNRAQAEQVIQAEVRNALQALRSAEARLVSATDARAASEELYSSEQRQFRSGTTTFYLVLQRQTDLARARSLELQARASLNRAISEFQRAIGATLTANKVTVSK